MGKRTYTYDGSEWVGLTSTTADLSRYANMDTTPISGFRNAIINGDFRVWQRGTSFSNPADSTYNTDRWLVEHDGTGATRTVSQQTFTPGTAPVTGYEGTYFLRYAVSGGTSNTYQQIEQRIEDVRTFAGQTVTLSFWAKSDATRTIQILNRRSFGSGGSTGDQTDLGTITTSTSWTRYSFTYAVPSVSGKTIGAGSYSQWNFRFAAATAQTIDIWGVQLEQGSIATPFEQRPIGTELALCQRYYIRYSATSAGSVFSQFGSGLSTTQTFVPFVFPVEMRAIPSSIDNNAIGSSDASTGAINATSAVLNGNTTNKISWVLLTHASGIVQFRPYVLVGQSGTIGYIGFSAEL